MIKIELARVDNHFCMQATNEVGNTVVMDGAPADGGQNQGMRPMQVLLAAMGGCSAIDVVSILKKQRLELRDLKITLTGEREKDKVPALYTAVHAHFRLVGNIELEKAQKAVALSVEKYCSVAKTLEKTATITYSVEVIS
ncbi:MAG: OsmC family protein [Cyclobacteriaceae bacterium]|jgi:putative redox protein|nr:OsmC family protein [Cyclobacteriaceae bacterium]